MDLEAFVSFLSELLQSPLPGQVAQKELMPSPVGANWKIKDRFAEQNIENARISGVLLLFYEKENEIYFPLIKRPEYDGAHSGQVSFPGGKMEKEDTSVVDTAKRETFEEIGIDQSKIEIVGQLSDLYIDVSNFLVSPVVGYTQNSFRFKPDTFEVERIIEVPIQYFLSDIVKSTVLNVRNYALNAPYFDIDNEVVWGATAMMLGELRRLLLPHKSKITP